MDFCKLEDVCGNILALPKWEFWLWCDVIFANAVKQIFVIGSPEIYNCDLHAVRAAGITVVRFRLASSCILANKS